MKEQPIDILNRMAAEAAYICADIVPASIGVRARDFEPIVKQAIRNFMRETPHQHWRDEKENRCELCGRKWEEI